MGAQHDDGAFVEVDGPAAVIRLGPLDVHELVSDHQELMSDREARPVEVHVGPSQATDSPRRMPVVEARWKIGPTASSAVKARMESGWSWEKREV